MRKIERGAKFSKKLLGLILVGLMLCITIGIVYFENFGMESEGTIPSGSLRPAPRFSLADAQGVRHALEDLKGNVVVLHFWASWCHPCLGEIPEWVNFSATFQDRPVKFVAISLDQNWEDALKILPKQATPSHQLLSLLDTSGKIAEEYGTYQFPETYLLNQDLKVLTKWVGPQDWSQPQFKMLIDEQLKAHK